MCLMCEKLHSLFLALGRGLRASPRSTALRLLSFRKKSYICVLFWYTNNKTMLVITSREFRENQASYFDRVDKGEEILIQRKKNKSYKIVPVTEDDTLMSKEEFFAKIDKSLQQAKEGKRYSMKEDESLDDFLDRIGADVQD